MPSVHQLPFAAAIPGGHDVVVITFHLENKSPTVVLDRTASVLYCSEDMWGPLHQDPGLAVKDPAAVATRWAWVVKSTVAGVCAGALVSTSRGGDRAEITTILLVEPAGVPYR